MSNSRAATIDLTAVDHVRLEASRHLDPERRIVLGQFMTPDPLARFMASLFSTPKGPVHLLDPGAGVGSLTAAALGRCGAQTVTVSAYEIDEILLCYLHETLGRFDGSVSISIIERDFIQDAVYHLTLGTVSTGFTHVILNPPYKKIGSNSEHRALLRAVGLETVNLYTAFVGLALELMAPSGELVAIIPRSFCNGPYYRPFREWILQRASLDHIHLFQSRTSAFNDDDVLQENVVIKLVRGKQQGLVRITTSSDTRFTDLESNLYPFAEIVHEQDREQFIHVPAAPTHSGIAGVPLASKSLAEIGIEVSTGPVVDFRLKEFLRQSPEPGTVPLLYPTHFADGALEWPKQSKKPNAIVRNEHTEKWLYPSGFYAAVKRFSSKEERRRIVAYTVEPSALQESKIGFENHLNVFHARKQGISKNLAHGLAVFLNSTAVDNYFRRFSGHTQVNATDLRILRYPNLAELEQLGQWSLACGPLTQDRIDKQVDLLHAQRT